MKKSDVLNALAGHQGRDKGIGAADLARKAGGTPRSLRRFISELREEGIAICGHPSTGYYMATTPEELNASCAYLEHRALHSLRLLSRMRKVSLADLMGQLKIKDA